MNDVSKSESNNNVVITVGRQFGSGGRELGQLLARELGISYYDKELLAEAAKSAGVSPEFFERRDERTPSFFNGLFSFAFGHTPVSYYSGSTTISDDGIYKAYSDFMRALAQRESCVIVGRTADYILRDHPRCVNLFVHAPMEECVKRIMARSSEFTDEAKARAHAEKMNKLRSNYYNFYTDKQWGHATSYDLTFDSSKMTMDRIVEIVKSYMAARGLIG